MLSIIAENDLIFRISPIQNKRPFWGLLLASGVFDYFEAFLALTDFLAEPAFFGADFFVALCAF